jgi:hypothetical protein
MKKIILKLAICKKGKTWEFIHTCKTNYYKDLLKLYWESPKLELMNTFPGWKDGFPRKT